MSDSLERHADPAVHEPDGKVGRRRFLVVIGSLPFAAAAGWALAACSRGEETPRPEAQAPQPAPAEPKPPAAAESKPPAVAEPKPPASSASPPPAASEPAADALVTEVAAMKPTVEALQYVNQSTKPDQSCSGCQFYTAQTAERGKCQLFPQGLVSSGGWCTSWTKRVTTS